MIMLADPAGWLERDIGRGRETEARFHPIPARRHPQQLEAVQLLRFDLTGLEAIVFSSRPRRGFSQLSGA
jgi:hypothetical protein